MCVCVVYSTREKTKNLHGVASFFCVYVCFWLKYLKRTVIHIRMCCIFVCVFYANKLSLSNKKKIVRFNTSHVHFVVFLAFCFIVHTGLFFSLCRILFAKNYASPFVLFLSLSVASVLV